ncbi:MAG: class I SAM-dependent methyltransferase [Gemmatimonadetes bacterium]|nr:class I SAM-dependent methyltransferase [Gemmatimonadota bacterium]
MSSIPRKPIHTIRDAERLDLALSGKIDWESFYAQGKRNPPFLTDKPDENLVSCFEQDCLTPGNAIDLGCGIGRNAVYLAKGGYRVDAIDLSETAIERGRSLARRSEVDVNFIVGSIFDLAYDAGLLHHLQPHRRPYYLEKIHAVLKPNGMFEMTCFDTSAGVPKEDWEIYEEGRMPPGIGYTEDRLRRILQHRFEIIEFRPMKVQSDDSGLFGILGLWTILMRPLHSRQVYQE